MKRLENYHYIKQIKIRVTLVLLFLITWVFSISYLSYISKTINLSVLIFCAIILLSYIFLLLANNKNKTKKTMVRNYKILETVLLIISVYLMIFNYSIYGLWDLIFLLVSPSIITGFIFIFALFLGIFIQNNIVKNLFVPVVCIYPIKYLNISSYWMIYGAILSAMLIAEIFNVVVENMKTNLHLAENTNSKVIIKLLKIIIPILIITMSMHFIIGYEAKASYANTISIKSWKSVISLLPFMLLMFVLFFEVDLKISVSLFLIGNLIVTFVFKNYTLVSKYNNTSLVILNSKLFFESNDHSFWAMIVEALTFSWILSCFCLLFEEWKVFNINFKLISKIDGNINRYKHNDSIELKLFILKAATSKALFFTDDKMVIDVFFKIDQKQDDSQLNKHILLLFLKKSITYLLPFNLCILSIVYSSILHETYEMKFIWFIFKSNFCVYLTLLISTILLFWAKFQNLYLGKWCLKKTKK